MDGVDVQNCVAGDNNAGEWDGGGGMGRRGREDTYDRMGE